MAKIYWLTGQSGAGKTVLGKKLVEFLSTEKRNWRSKVFHIDDGDLRELTINKEYSNDDRIQNILNAQLMTEYIYKNGCDVVVSLISPYRELRNEFKTRIGADLEEFYIHNSKSKVISEYEDHQYDIFMIDTAKENPIQSFTKIVHYLKEN
jgi:adenylylsulfate kinase-like enzyme